MRRGFSLTEALVALVLFQVGMLALAATTAVAARDLSTAMRRTRATAMARNGLQLLQVTACSGAASASRAQWPGGYTETRAVAVAGSTIALVDSVAFALPAGRRGHVALHAVIQCG